MFTYLVSADKSSRRMGELLGLFVGTNNLKGCKGNWIAIEHKVNTD